MIAGRRIGVIDVGSNSVRLLVADVNSQGINGIYKDLNTTRLYKDITEDNKLNDEAMDRTVDAIYDYVDIANSRSCDEIYMFATAAVRVAKNKDEFKSRVRKKTRIILEIISEDKEAELAFAGVDSHGICGVIDIGGASTELAIGRDGKISESSSAKIGAVKCKENLDDDRDTEKIISYIESILINESTNTIEYAQTNEGIEFFGVGGTITTMAAMLANLDVYDSDVINGTKFSYDDLTQMIAKLQAMDINERREVVGLQEKRADIIVYGLLILQTVMKNCNITYVQASDNDNLEGYIQLLIRED